MTVEALVKGWCPGALRPMESGDGLLVRIRITGGILKAEHAHVIAKSAMQYGNGLIDLSGRANLQIRGVSGSQWPHLIADLSHHGLLDDDAEAEAVRNVVASPLARLDPSAMLDIRPLVKALENRLVSDRALHALPGKFGFLVDDGGQFSLSDQNADIAFEALQENRTTYFVVRIGQDDTAGIIGIDSVCDTAAALAHAFIDASRASVKPYKRMVNWVADWGADRILKSVGIDTIAVRPRRSTDLSPFGFHALGESGFLGLGAPFGRWSANGLAALADIALAEGSGELRLTPWRAILIPGLHQTRAQTLIAKLGEGFISRADDPRLQIIACAGRPSCRNATVNTHQDALGFATLQNLMKKSGTRLHVSGCEKGCARPAATEAVLVGKNGVYDLVLNGKASDSPMMKGLDEAMARRTLEDLWAGEAK
ncbi:MAG: precorrin-3B synthase [Beijerinckiaceae bacterium]|nr:precorrin-3B synthase [Beijerinckiaceae bacterium]